MSIFGIFNCAILCALLMMYCITAQDTNPTSETGMDRKDLIGILNTINFILIF